MADKEHLAILSQGKDACDRWRKEHPYIKPDLSGANLSGVDLRGMNLRGGSLNGANLSKAKLSNADLSSADLGGTNLRGANLREADLSRADLRGADLRGADVSEADLRWANLGGANLSRADLSGVDLRSADGSEADLRWTNLRGVNLSGVNLSGANLSGANLILTVLVETVLEDANLTGCKVYGASTWGLRLEGATQVDLIITPDDRPPITVDNLEVAQFVYLLLKNKKIRDVVDTIGKKAILLLGRFTDARKPVLEAIRDRLRECGYLPILFDFDPPRSRDLTETVATLAHLSRFIIADITEPPSMAQELAVVLPALRSVPIQPILADSDGERATFEQLKAFPWVLDVQRYHDVGDLLAGLKEKVIDPAEAKADELRLQKGENP